MHEKEQENMKEFIVYLYKGFHKYCKGKGK